MNKQELMEKIKPGDHWISVTSGMSGYFAVEYWLNNEESYGPFVEPYSTGFGRYRTYDMAKAEALAMAEDMGLPFIE